MISADLYTPNLSVLSKKGVSFISFQPKTEDADSLLSRTALEYGLTSVPLSYYVAAHPELGFLHLKSGSLCFTAFPSEIPVTLSGESSLLFDCNYPYRIMSRTIAEYEIVYFSGNSLDYFRTHLLNGHPVRQNAHTPVLLSEAALLYQQTEISPLLCHGLLTMLLTRIAMEDIPCPDTIPSWLINIKNELTSQYYHKHTLDELEEEHKINKYRICREFKNYFQISPMQYLHKIRIQAAKSLLLETDIKIHELGYEVGYENVNHFIHHFKSIVGLTPTEYRNKLQ